MDSDCVIIGAGPAGMHCATYLGRFIRKTVIFNGGKARGEWIPRTHNFPGFPDGISGSELLALLRKQAKRYQVEIHDERAIAVESSDGGFIVRGDTSEVSTRRVVFATGVYDIPPEVPNPHDFKADAIRHCPVCDAYECRGRRMVIFGWGERAAREAVWLAHYTADLTILTTGHGTMEDVSPQIRSYLQDLRIPIIDKRIASIEKHYHQLGCIVFEDGNRIEGIFRGYSAMGITPHSLLAADLGVALDPKGFILVNQLQQTNVSGVYAIGDIVSGVVGQLSVAMGHASIAACAVHNSMMPF